MRAKSLVVLGLGLFLVNGCKRQGGDGAGGAAVDHSADAAAQRKLQPVIACINQTLDHFERLAPLYRMDVQALSKGATNVPEFVQFKIAPFETNGEFLIGCANGLEKSAGESPAMNDLDAPAKDEAAALRAIGAPGAQMDAYLTQKVFLSDHFSGGKTLDATLTPLLERIVSDSGLLRAAVQRQEAVLQQHELDAIDKAEGHSLRWHTKATMIAARALNEGMVHMANSHTLTEAGVSAAIAPMQAAMDDTQAFLNAHPDAGKPGPNGMPPVWSVINSSLSAELGAAREVGRLQGSIGNRMGEVEHAQIYSQMQAITMDFNGAVQNYNSLTENGAR